jgi:tetratricopeptide (TPR) repeat protein
LLRYVKDHEAEPAARTLLLDAVQLTRICAHNNPPTVFKTFRQLEQLLKRHGNKRLVLELAELTITAASDPFSRDEEAVRAEAQALICGRAWALQRLGDLAGAQKAGNDSLDLGEAIRWDRNTAFCQKCNGRLARLYAEQEANQSERAKYLDQSIKLLTTAIATFGSMSEIGPDHPEVGDCFSLIARTYLVGKQYGNAKEALQEAYRRIRPKDAKDYLDLLILSGDLEAATGKYDYAENLYSEALAMPASTDAQISEIFARGYLQRGKNRAKLGRTEGARSDFGWAASIWKTLEEYERAAEADWEGIRLLEAVPNLVITKFEESFSHLVRVTAYERYVQEYKSSQAQTVGQRSTPSDVHLSQLLQEAKRSVKIKYPRP